MNDHHRFRELVGPHVLGLLGPDEERQLQRHLIECRTCREEEAELHVVHRGLTKATTPPSSELKDRLMERSRRRRWQISGAIGAASRPPGGPVLRKRISGSPASTRYGGSRGYSLSYQTRARSERRSASRRDRCQHAHKAPSFGAVPASIRRVLRDVVPERRQANKLRRVHDRF
jgi:Putative zinc-finger